MNVSKRFLAGFSHSSQDLKFGQDVWSMLCLSLANNANAIVPFPANVWSFLSLQRASKSNICGTSKHCFKERNIICVSALLAWSHVMFSFFLLIPEK